MRYPGWADADKPGPRRADIALVVPTLKPGAKWIEGVEDAAPLDQAAAAVVRQRIGMALSWAKRMGGSGAATPQEAHQLRVATRRAGAALGAFRACFDEGDARRLRKSLRSLRRAAADVRTADVHRALLLRQRRRASDEEKPALDALLRDLDERRERAVPALLEAVSKKRRAKVRGRLERAVGRVGAPADGPATFGEAARSSLARFSGALHSAGSETTGGVEALHRVRLASKDLRYGLEIFADALGPEIRRDLYPRLEELQETLGAVNDAAELSTMLDRQLAALDAGTEGHAERRTGLASLARRVRQQRDDLVAGFDEWWAAFERSGFFEAAARLAGGRAGGARTKAVANGFAGGGHASRNGPVQAAHADEVVPQPHPEGDEEEKRMRLAAIDVGTNSIRLIVAEAYADGSYRVLDDEKEITRLGRGLAATGALDPDAMEQSALAVERMRSIADGYGANLVRLVGTAAVREASNGPAFARMVRERSGLDMETLSAQEEARLSHLSASHAFDLRAVPAVVVDIGGGSTEIVLTSGGVIEQIYTIPLGAVRLTEQFGGPADAAGGRFDEMRRWIRSSVESVIDEPPFKPQILIGAGGTFESLAKAAMLREQGDRGAAGAPIRGFDLRRSEVKRLLKWLRGMTLAERAKTPGLSPQRAEIIVAGVAILARVMKQLGVERLRVHDGGIRDGLLLSMLHEQFHAEGDPTEVRGRMRSVRQFAASCRYERRHCYHVAGLALSIYDQLVALLAGSPAGAGEWATPEARTLLESAAILHDCGYHINYDKHHLHSYHLIVHSDLAGFSRREIEIVANVARYHRGGEPKASHAPWAALARGDRELVRRLGAILRLADGLDRTHTQTVRGAAVRLDKGRAVFVLDAEKEPAVDVWGSHRKSGLFTSVFGLEPAYEWAGAPVAPVPERAAPNEKRAASNA